MGSLKKGFRFACRNADGLEDESSKSQERGWKDKHKYNNDCNV